MVLRLPWEEERDSGASESVPPELEHFRDIVPLLQIHHFSAADKV
jgi:hypothetical protein